MASNLDYLDPALQPLEANLKAYLATEKQLQQATVAATLQTHPSAQPDIPVTQPSATADFTPEPQGAPAFEQRSATGSYDQHTEDSIQRLKNLQDELVQLRRVIVQQLPVRNEWVKVNLGYGPSRVGAFTADEAASTNGEVDLRIVI